MAGELRFTKWQIDRIRRALILYYESKGYNGNVLPWKTVESRIMRCPPVIDSPGVKEEIFSEKLRRFAKRTEIPSVGKLDQIRTFLEYERFLTKDELRQEPDSHQEMLAARRYLSNQSEEAISLVSDLAETYVSVRRFGDISERAELRLLVEKAGGYFLAEEEFSEGVKDETRMYLPQKKDRLKMKRTMTGYGFVSTSLNLIYVFLRGATERARINYVEVDTVSRSMIRDVLLMRSGDPAQTPLPELEREQANALTYNLFRFSPDGVPFQSRYGPPSKPEDTGRPGSAS